MAGVEGRIFRTQLHSPTDELKTRIGEVVCLIVQPFIFEIVDMKNDGGLHFTITCKVTGKATDVGKQFMEEKTDE